MFIFLIAITMTTELCGMQLCTVAQKKLIDLHINNTFNINALRQFNVESICNIYASKNLITNINSILDILEKEAYEKIWSPAHLDNLKKAEQQFVYVVFLKQFVQFFPTIVKAIKHQCTLPLSIITQKRLLRRFWYAHWALSLPLQVEKLYQKGIAMSCIVGQQKELLEQFKIECISHKSLHDFKQPISCYRLCNLLAEKFLLIADEIEQEKHKEIQDKTKMLVTCYIAAKMCQELLHCIKSLKPWIMVKKGSIKSRGLIKQDIIKELLTFWTNFWKSPYSRPNYKKNIIKQLKKDIKNMANEYLQNNI